MSEDFSYFGLSDEQVIRSRKIHGKNLITPPPETPWWKLYLQKFMDPIILILLVATGISLIFGFIHGNFTESIGIIAAILVATGVGFWQEYSAKKKFDEMKSDKDFEPVRVRRNGIILDLPKNHLVVDDIVILSAGDEVPADLLLYSSTDLKVSEASLTGESKAVSKYPLEESYSGSGFAPNLLLRGTIVENGNGEARVIAVGDNTEIGKTTRKAFEETGNKTPLEEKLNELAGKINIAAFIIAGSMFLILNITHRLNNPFVWSWDILLQEIQFLMASVVVIIVAVPEGLPLAVTMSLAFSMKTMAKENNLVKKMHACETIGAVNIIFTDKTGTLTQNKMSVVEKDAIDDDLDIIGALNSTAQWSSRDTVLGNPTECAILRELGKERYEDLRKGYVILDTIPFNSSRKYMVTYMRDILLDTHILVKGAPEVILEMINLPENDPLLEESEEILRPDLDCISRIPEQQARGRRAISGAIIKEENWEEVKRKLEAGEKVNGEYCGTWYIEDPIRSDVPEAIEKSYKAGIDVVMMTGDNLATATEIGRQAGLEDIWAVETKDFWKEVNDPNSLEYRVLPNVIARCTPEDKLQILKWAQEKGFVCAMTGDGCNDGPSLNHADIGLAMGSGTSVAKEAADIILLDDAFPSIITGVKWGRSLFKNIKNFLFLQLSINVSACLIAVFGPLVGVEMPFTVTQFLWINLVMDSLAAIALASEPADENVLLDKPRNKKEFIINKSLAKAIFGFGGFTWLLCTFVLWGMKNLEWMSGINLTIFFAGYMMLNWWNMFNARVIGKDKSVFSGLFQNSKFYGIMAFILVVTILMVQLGGKVFRTEPLTLITWLEIVLITSPVMWVKELWFRLFKKRA